MRALSTIIFLFSISLSHLINAQSDKAWVFGFRAGLDFNTIPPTPFINSLVTREPSASVCDDDGKLLFYTNGTKIWAADNSLMPNGSNLHPYTGGGMDAIESTSQGSLIAPVPQKPNLFYVFSLTSEITRAGELYYSVVDMNLNNNKGDVVAGQKAILLDTLLTEQMITVSGTDCNIWLLNIARNGTLKARSIDQSGINATPIISPIDISNPPNTPGTYGGAIGCMSISPDNKQLAIVRYTLSLFNFNNTSGTASDGILLSEDEDGFYGSCFSSDNKKLYVSALSGDGIFQYDLSSNDANQIKNSKTQIQNNSGLWQLKRGLDNKIYITKYGKASLDVIQQPNLAGTACQYSPDAQTLALGSNGLLGIGNTISTPLLNELEGNVSIQNICEASWARLSARTEALSIVWHNGSNSSSIEVQQDGIYWVKMRMPNCIMITDTFKITFQNPQLITENSCYNSGTGKAYIIQNTDDSISHYTWVNAQGDTLSTNDTFQNIAAGDYKVYIQTLSGCNKVFLFTIQEESYPLAFQTDTLICIGNQVQLTNSSDPYYTEYLWNFGDGEESTSAQPTHQYQQPGTYTISLAGKGETCTDTVYATIVVSDTLRNTSFTVDNSVACVGTVVVFNVNEIDSLRSTFQWSWGDGNHTQSLQSQQKHSYAYEGHYEITLIQEHLVCPSKTYTQNITVHSVPKVFIGNDTSLCSQSSAIILQNHYGHQSGYRYAWSTGDTSLQLKVPYPGEYSLIVTNAEGCSSSDRILVDKDCYIDIPNAFTPNGDGVNDFFFPRKHKTGIVNLQMQIFNRLGQLIFKSQQGEGMGWDGKWNDQAQPAGVYIYTIEVNFDNGVTETYQGNVTLIR